MYIYAQSLHSDVKPMFYVYYNYMKMNAAHRIRTQDDSIPAEHTNHSPKSPGGPINTTYDIIRLNCFFVGAVSEQYLEMTTRDGCRNVSKPRLQK